MSIIMRHLLLLITSVPFCTGLYEDQAGLYDWRQQFIGQVQFVHWDQSRQPGKRLLVGTGSNVLAAINAQNGQIVWRKLLEKDDRGKIDSLLHHSTALITVTGGGSVVRSWNSNTGLLRWEAAFSDIEVPASGSSCWCGSQKENVVVVSRQGLAFLKSQNGHEEWTVSLPDSESAHYKHLFISENKIISVGISPASHVTIVMVSLAGEMTSQRTVTAPWITVTSSCTLVADKYLVCYQKSPAMIQYLELLAGDMFNNLLLEDMNLLEEDDTAGVSNLRSDYEGPEFALKLGRNHLVVFKMMQDSALKLVKDMPGFSAAHFVENEDVSMLIATRRTSDMHVAISTFDLTTAGEMVELAHDLHIASFHGNPDQILPAFMKKKDGRSVYRAVLTFEDASFQFMQTTGKIGWRREESLASIIAVDMVDLPVSETEAKFEDEFGSPEDDIIVMFYKRFKTQILQLQSFITQLVHKLQGHRHHSHDLGMEGEEESGDDDDEELTRDQFNLNKVIIVVTSFGKIFGLQSTNGRIVWQHYLPDLAPFDRYGKKIVLMYMQRTTAHFPLPPNCVIIGKDKKTGRGLLFAFNPVTGQRTGDTPPGGRHLGYSILQAAMMNEVDDHFLKAILLVDDEYQVHTYPSHAVAVVKAHMSSLFLYVTDIDKDSMTGLRITEDGKLRAEPIWNINLQNQHQMITNVVAKPANEHIHSQGRVLGDRSVLYKYLNPNLILVTAEGLEGGGSVTNQKGAANGFLNVYLLDAVTGHIIFHMSHKRVRGPVHVVHSENWVAYNYVNQKHRRTEITVLELYEGKQQLNSTAFSSFNSLRQPLVMRQSYIFPHTMSTMAVTITEKGITSKSVLIALKAGALFALPKAFLDPRRPVTRTQDHLEEGVLPYMPELMISTEAILNYNQSVLQIDGLYTHPAGLESTCLVLAYGIDLFYTRVMPSKTFDVLKEDFDYFFISIVVLAMILVSVVSQKLAARKAIARAWR